jgi:hypothetical protein
LAGAERLVRLARVRRLVLATVPSMVTYKVLDGGVLSRFKTFAAEQGVDFDPKRIDIDSLWDLIVPQKTIWKVPVRGPGVDLPFEHEGESFVFEDVPVLDFVGGGVKYALATTLYEDRLGISDTGASYA